jgi:putative nucleotidyltransferase with HDIG domain
MSELSHSAAFLSALGRLLDLASGEESDPESRSQASEDLDKALAMMLRQNAFPSFTFRYGEIEYEGELMEDLRSWPWSLRLPEAGVERLDITPGTTREDLDGFVDEVLSRLLLKEGASVRELHGSSGIRFTELDLADGGEGTALRASPATFDFNAEAETMAWLNSEVETRGIVPVAEAAAIVQLLSVAMHLESNIVLPLVELKTVDQYTTTHCINVSCLSMAVAEHLRYSSVDVRAIGEAALLHDVGKTKIPLAVLNKPGKLTPDEWKLIQSHTSEGARILLASSGRMELAAIVAYEHHMDWTGGGYPEVTSPRQPHPISRLIQVCDVYDALRTRRPFRSPWPHSKAVEFLRTHAGQKFDPEYVDDFLSMIRQCEPRHTQWSEAEPEENEAA